MLKRFRWQIAQFVELKWWKRYLKTQSVDAYLEWKRNYWKQFLVDIHFEEIKEWQKEDQMLDMGCGPAGIFSIFSNRTIIAVDPLLDAYENELMHFEKANYPQVLFYQDTIEDFVSDKVFDIVFCLNCINHVIDIGKAMSNLNQLSSQDAILIISTDAHRFNLLKFIFSCIPGDILHPHQYTQSEYLQIFEASGFKLLRAYVLKQESIFDYCVFVMKKA